HFFYLYVSAYARALHSFPTRRSSDLALRSQSIVAPVPEPSRPFPRSSPARAGCGGHACPPRALVDTDRFPRPAACWPRPSQRSRSEEHTSELQSRENLVCRLLLEKKK